LGEIIEEKSLPAQRDIDGRCDLLDRPEAIGAIKPDVARPIEKIAG
jgi:hypothetical protein